MAVVLRRKRLEVKLKHIISLLLLATGVYFIVHGIGLAPQPEPPKDFWQKTDAFFTNNPMWNPIIEFFGGTPIQETPKPSKTPAIIHILVGTLFILGGTFISLYPRKK